uniref:DUF22 domain-containing protein n=1 Tax=Archaeoglobus fulgidus TaxID=2234 RepID=A0A7J2TGZ2_ARCFL
MDAVMKYWVDVFGGKLEKLKIDLKPFGFRMAPVTQWKTLIADRDVEVKKGNPTIVRVQTLTLPANTIVGPMNIMRHALGCVLDVVECGIPTRVEEEKCINNVVFLPIDDGEIKKGDIIGVLKVFFVKTGLIGKTLGLGQIKVDTIKERVVGNLVWRDDGNIYRERVEVEEFSYKRTHVGVWEPLISDENVTVHAGEVRRIKIRELKLPPNTIVVPIGFMMNAYGSVVDVIQIGKPSRAEEEKRINEAIFLAVEDGKIEKGDLLGILCVYYIGLDDFKPLIRGEKKEFTMLYRSGRGVIKKAIKIDPFGFKRSPIGRWEPIIADEKKKLEKNKPCIIAVKKIKLPRNTMVYPMGIMRSPYAVVIDTVLERIARVEEEKNIRHAVILPLLDGEVEKGDILGIINVYEVEVSTIEKLRTWFDDWIEAQQRILYE